MERHSARCAVLIVHRKRGGHTPSPSEIARLQLTFFTIPGTRAISTDATAVRIISGTM